jgi:hypothetical protein
MMVMQKHVSSNCLARFDEIGIGTPQCHMKLVSVTKACRTLCLQMDRMACSYGLYGIDLAEIADKECTSRSVGSVGGYSMPK